ncbi:unnamed protein product, partial [Rotaria magnacalcarata]
GENLPKSSYTLIVCGSRLNPEDETTPNEIKSFIRSCTNSTLVSQLNEILPNFEIHSNQEYILSRIQSM